jgi:hypothetical protein
MNQPNQQIDIETEAKRKEKKAKHKKEQNFLGRWWW